MLETENQLNFFARVLPTNMFNDLLYVYRFLNREERRELERELWIFDEPDFWYHDYVLPHLQKLKKGNNQ